MNKILFITNVYPNKNESFRGIYIQNRAIELNKNGYNCRVAFLDKDGRKTIDIFSNTFLYDHKPSKLNYFGIGKKPIIEKSFYKFIDSFSPDLIIFCVTSLWIKLELLKKIGHYKFANFFEGRNADGQFKNNKYYSLLIKPKENRIFKRMDYLFFCSELALNDFKVKFPKIDSEKCKVLINGFDKNIFKPVDNHVFDSKMLKIISVGNISETKGQKIVAKAINEISKIKNQKVVFEIVGTGAESELNEISKTIDSNNVTYVYKEQLSPIELSLELKKFDYFILPSYFESFGCVYLEAMSQGLITIGCQNQGPSIYIENNKNGFLVKENNVNDLLDCLIKVTDGKTNLESISKEAIKQSKNFGWDRFVYTFKLLKL